eukprot:CAMPEP_0194492560 /NCGR_PEP_ID=MMETSP0253-20130528/11069_1 /TAXON_ID=2966 /ORGANISM="Noctiluca scintillans" /LENGTH=385 /DNA_ID=CAMNT_0039333439 /DNA_START=96 /DNA_END=1252 /DNA_ORIENTATION=-
MKQDVLNGTTVHIGELDVVVTDRSCTVVVQCPEESSVLVQALRSLREEELEPQISYVARRLEEWQGKRYSQEELRCLSLATPSVRIEEAGGRAWLHEEGLAPLPTPEALDDVHPNVWAEIRRFVDAAASNWDVSTWPRSRYDLARDLQHELPSLAGRKLGYVFRILDLAVKVHKLFGYRAGHIVPYFASSDFEKRMRAEGLIPTVLPCVGTWDDVREKLSVLMDSSEGIPLSALKFRFRERFGLELNETALGHTKFSDFVADPRLSGVCELDSGNSGSERLLRRPPECSSSDQVGKHHFVTREGDEGGEGQLHQPVRDVRPKPQQPCQAQVAALVTAWQPYVARTFIEFRPQVFSGERRQSDPGPIRVAAHLVSLDSLHVSRERL